MARKRLYVWREVFRDWSAGIAFALAESPQEAREVIARREDGSLVGHVLEELAGTPEVHEETWGTYMVGGA